MADPISATLLCLVVAISDGDTLKVRCEQRLEQPAQTLTVRLAEIDAPEKRQAFGTRSRAHLAMLCFGRPATLNVSGKDRYGRSIARVTCGDTDANAAQVQAGLAWAYEQYLTDGSIKADEQTARAAQRGLWADAAPVPPWQWRQQQRQR
jgi:endonuclease YncB( thermonuclease family)